MDFWSDDWSDDESDGHSSTGASAGSVWTHGWHASNLEDGNGNLEDRDHNPVMSGAMRQNRDALTQAIDADGNTIRARAARFIAGDLFDADTNDLQYSTGDEPGTTPYREPESIILVAVAKNAPLPPECPYGLYYDLEFFRQLPDRDMSFGDYGWKQHNLALQFYRSQAEMHDLSVVFFSNDFFDPVPTCSEPDPFVSNDKWNREEPRIPWRWQYIVASLNSDSQRLLVTGIDATSSCRGISSCRLQKTKKYDCQRHGVAYARQRAYDKAGFEVEVVQGPPGLQRDGSPKTWKIWNFVFTLEDGIEVHLNPKWDSYNRINCSVGMFTADGMYTSSRDGARRGVTCLKFDTSWGTPAYSPKTNNIQVKAPQHATTFLVPGAPPQKRPPPPCPFPPSSSHLVPDYQPDPEPKQSPPTLMTLPLPVSPEAKPKMFKPPPPEAQTKPPPPPLPQRPPPKPAAPKKAPPPVLKSPPPLKAAPSGLTASYQPKLQSKDPPPLKAAATKKAPPPQLKSPPPLKSPPSSAPTASASKRVHFCPIPKIIYLAA